MRPRELLVLKPSHEYPGQIECRSAMLGIIGVHTNEKEAVNFVKGATLCALGELWKEIPDEVVISFEIDRSALEGTPVQP